MIWSDIDKYLDDIREFQSQYSLNIQNRELAEFGQQIKLRKPNLTNKSLLRCFELLFFSRVIKMIRILKIVSSSFPWLSNS